MNPAAVLEIALVVAVVGAALFAAVWTLRRAGALLPLRRRGRYRRLVPLLELGLAAAAILTAAALLLDSRPTALAAVSVALLALVLGAAWFAIRDLVTGAVLRAEEVYEPGQWIRVDDVDGRIREVGARTLEIEREDGTRVRIPYTGIAGAHLVRAARTEDPTGHTFTVALPPGLGPVRMLPVIRAAARNCFFVSATRDPQVHVTSGPAGHRYDITVFTLDRTFLPEVESAVRRRIDTEVSAP
ncbi:MAG TPA: mechanosensitive ion channel domain-containing protein [Longimicrobiales bacterium]|nr:mechanosensitive ion channel domain-containing protein [Longimicrobiales bacterium]